MSRPIQPQDAPKRFISVIAELEELEAAIVGARVSADTLRFAAYGERADDPDLREVPSGISATLTLVIGRVRLLRRVIEREAPAQLLVAHHNSVDEEMAAERHDLLIPVDAPR